MPCLYVAEELSNGFGEMEKEVTDRNELAVLEALVRTLRLTAERTAALSAIFRNCKGGLPPPVIDEVFDRLIAQGHVEREVRSSSAVGLAGDEREIPETIRDEIRYLITEEGYERYNAVVTLQTTSRLVELRSRISGLGLTERHHKMWASLHDHLMWKPSRTVQFTNYGLGFKLTPDEIWQFREILFDLGLVERVVVESHVKLTELGMRFPRFSSLIHRQP